MNRTKPTTLDFALLGLLHQQPQSGYDLRKIFETTAMGSYSGSPGAIYPALRRLEAQGLIEGDVDNTRELRPKKMFRPTMLGTRTLCRWLSSEIRREDMERRVDELMLRFAFHGILDSRTETRRFLESFLREAEAYVKELKSQGKMMPEETPLHARLALAAGVAQFQTSARWARQALKAFQEETR